MDILNSRQMEQCDSYTINEIGIPSVVLMENAALAVFDHFDALDIEKENLAVIAGIGNNGGDGLALARILINNGYHVEVYIVGDATRYKGDAKTNYDILLNYPVQMFSVEEDDIPNFFEYDVIFDSVFGTGLSRPLDGFYAELIERVNLAPGFKIAVDIPSGLSGMTHNIIGPCMTADVTVTFCRPKLPHCFYPAKKICGSVYVADISIPDFSVNAVEPEIFLITAENIPLLMHREPDSHKGDFGHACLAGGSKGKSGAIIMASLAATKIGAGLTTCIIPEQLNYVVETSIPEIMSFPCGDADYLNQKAANEAVEFLEGKSVVGIGCGMGTNEKSADFITTVAEKTDLPVVLDADGINLLNKKTLKKLKNKCILTPHIGEFARFLNLTTKEVLEKKIELAKEFAVKYEVILVLKSADTLIAMPDGTICVNETGSPALSKGGSGDCLTGLITGLIAQKLDLEEAVILAVYLLGRASELASMEMNERTVLTRDVIEKIGAALDEISD